MNAKFTQIGPLGTFLLNYFQLKSLDNSKFHDVCHGDLNNKILKFFILKYASWIFLNNIIIRKTPLAFSKKIFYIPWRFLSKLITIKVSYVYAMYTFSYFGETECFWARKLWHQTMLGLVYLTAIFPYPSIIDKRHSFLLS